MRAPSALPIAVLTVAMAFPRVAQTQGTAIKVIVNRDVAVTKVTRPELARIYLGKKTLWESNARIDPTMIDEDAPPMQGFLEKTLQKSVDQYRNYWKRLLFSGGATAPRTFRTAAQVVDFVATHEGAIGVVDVAKPDDRVKVIEVVDEAH